MSCTCGSGYDRDRDDLCAQLPPQRTAQLASRTCGRGCNTARTVEQLRNGTYPLPRCNNCGRLMRHIARTWQQLVLA